MDALTWKDIEIKTQGSKAQFFIHITKGKQQNIRDRVK